MQTPQLIRNRHRTENAGLLPHCSGCAHRLKHQPSEPRASFNRASACDTIVPLPSAANPGTRGRTKRLHTKVTVTSTFSTPASFCTDVFSICFPPSCEVSIPLLFSFVNQFFSFFDNLFLQSNNFDAKERQGERNSARPVRCMRTGYHPSFFRVFPVPSVSSFQSLTTPSIISVTTRLSYAAFFAVITGVLGWESISALA